jgi:hypothetical protein
MKRKCERKKKGGGEDVFLCPRLTRMTSTILLVVSRTINKDTSERGEQMD